MQASRVKGRPMDDRFEVPMSSIVTCEVNYASSSRQQLSCLAAGRSVSAFHVTKLGIINTLQWPEACVCFLEICTYRG
jgi:hypothetical protein